MQGARGERSKRENVKVGPSALGGCDRRQRIFVVRYGLPEESQDLGPSRGQRSRVGLGQSKEEGEVGVRDQG